MNDLEDTELRQAIREFITENHRGSLKIIGQYLREKSGPAVVSHLAMRATSRASAFTLFSKLGLAGAAVDIVWAVGSTAAIGLICHACSNNKSIKLLPKTWAVLADYSNYNANLSNNCPKILKTSID